MNAKGSCLCGAIEFHFTGEPQETALCHCIDCQKWSGSAFTSNAVVPKTAFEVTNGTPRTWEVTADSGKMNRRSFCSNCGSSLYSELQVMPEMVSVNAGALNGGAAEMNGKVGSEIYVKDRVGYLNSCDGAKQSQKRAQ